MSESPSVARRRRAQTAQSGQPVFPGWFIEAFRHAGRTFSRVLWRIRYTGVENIPLTGGLIIAANHQTYMDPFWLGFEVRRPMRFLTWDAVFTWPVIGKVTGLFGAWPLQIEGSDPSAIRRSLQWLRGGGAVVIFPEGERCSPEGSLRRFKNGAVRMALEANVPILPVTIRGAHRIWPKGYRFPRLASVEIIYHPVHHVTLRSGEDARSCARRESDRLAQTISSAL